MSADKSHVFEEFKRGERSLFIVKRKGVSVSKVSLRDIVVQKWKSGVRMMLWDEAARAEVSVLKAGVTADFEVHLITPDELWTVATQIWGSQAEQEFHYFICE